MLKPDSDDLAQYLGSMGTVSLERLIRRQTGSTRELFESLVRLRNQGLVEIYGDSKAVDTFLEEVETATDTGSDSDKKQVLELLANHRAAAKAGVGLSKRGFSKSLTGAKKW